MGKNTKKTKRVQIILKRRENNPMAILSFYVAPLGLEPRQTEPESVVLPLHNRAMLLAGAKVIKT